LVQQARALEAQADATRAGIRPQVGFIVAFTYLGNNNQIPQGIGSALFYADWTITDSGATRRRAAAQRQQEVATLKRRADAAAAVALEVRTRWLDLHQARLRVPVARLAIAQAEENIAVVSDRYRQELSTYTEVLDAENRRVQSLTNFYNAIYDESQALFRLHRAVGDL
jgi:outer membrane protein